MKRRITIEVQNKAEFEAVQRAVQEPDVMAFLKVVGTLGPISERGRRRVLNYVADHLHESASA